MSKFEPISFFTFKVTDDGSEQVLSTNDAERSGRLKDVTIPEIIENQYRIR